MTFVCRLPTFVNFLKTLKIWPNIPLQWSFKVVWWSFLRFGLLNNQFWYLTFSSVIFIQWNFVFWFFIFIFNYHSQQYNIHNILFTLWNLIVNLRFWSLNQSPEMSEKRNIRLEKSESFHGNVFYQAQVQRFENSSKMKPMIS